MIEREKRGDMMEQDKWRTIKTIELILKGKRNL